MSTFDYITSDEFRKSLEGDFHEMSLCFEIGAWKAVHVLAGSIIEAILLDYISSENLVSQTDVLKLDLGSAINLCRENKIISTKTSDLSSVIKGYRNLIHPGRMIRLGDKVDKNSAEVAKALVGIVVSEIEEQKNEKYGFTAEQIVSKIRRDSSVDIIIPAIIKQTNPAEIEKLLLKVLPNSYMEYLQEFDTIYHLPSSFSKCFRIAYEQANADLMKKVSNNFVRIIKQESDSFIFAYGKLFFRASDMKFLSSDDIEIVKGYLLDRLENDSEGWLQTISGIGKFITNEEIEKFVDTLVRVINSNDLDAKTTAENILIAEDWDPSVEKNILKRLDEWVEFYKTKNLENFAIKIINVRTSIGIPF